MICQPYTIAPGVVVLLVLLHKHGFSLLELASKIIAKFSEKSLLLPDLESFRFSRDALICEILLFLKQLFISGGAQDIHLLDVPSIIVALILL